MGNCCTSNPGGTGPELNSMQNHAQAIESDKYTARQMALLIKIQARFRGFLTRKHVKQTHGFEARVMGGMMRLN